MLNVSLMCSLTGDSSHPAVDERQGEPGGEGERATAGHAGEDEATEEVPGGGQDSTGAQTAGEGA